MKLWMMGAPCSDRSAHFSFISLICIDLFRFMSNVSEP